MERSSCGGAKGFGCEGIRGAALSRGNRCGCGGTKCGGSANDGAYIAGVLHTGEDHDQRGRVGWGWTGDVVEGESARRNEGGDALGMFGVSDGFEEAVGGLQGWDGYFGSVEILGEARAVAFAGFAEENGANW